MCLTYLLTYALIVTVCNNYWFILKQEKPSNISIFIRPNCLIYVSKLKIMYFTLNDKHLIDNILSDNKSVASLD